MRNRCVLNREVGGRLNRKNPILRQKLFKRKGLVNENRFPFFIFLTQIDRGIERGRLQISTPSSISVYGTGQKLSPKAGIHNKVCQAFSFLPNIVGLTASYRRLTADKVVSDPTQKAVRVFTILGYPPA